MDNYIGQMLDDRYEILEELGSGGMAIVYKALCHRLNRMVAIKILKQDASGNSGQRRRLLSESQAVAMLSHPNIVSVYDVSSSDQADYIVMELVDGISLKQYMQQKGILPWREALHFAAQIASALEHAHSRGIVHRDIKPHNILLLQDGSVKVADFGIARIMNSENTQTREALGSVHYISPEQAKGGRIDQRTDLYSLGVVMYEMLTGKLPYDGETAVSVAIQHISGNYQPIQQLNPDVPEGLVQIVQHAMSPQAADRYESAAQLLADLEDFRQNQNRTFSYRQSQPVPLQQEQQSDPPAAEEHVHGGNRLMLGIIAAFMVLAFLGIGFFLYSYILKDLFSTPAELDAPSLLGESYSNFGNYEDFVIEVDKWAYSEEIPYGIVMTQDPESGRKVKKGATIHVVLSQGAEENRIPQLTNMNRNAAELLLRGMNLNVQIVEEYSSVYVSGQVIRSEPAFGMQVQKGDTVTLYISKGVELELIPVPNLLGKPVDEALKELKASGLSNGVLTYREDEQEKDTVLEQSMEAGNYVKPTTVINLVVSLGKEEETVPDEATNQDDKPDGGEQQTDPPAEDDPTPPVDPDEPPAEIYDQGNPNPDAYSSQVLEVPLPVGTGTVTVSVLCNGVQYGTPFVASLDEKSIQLAVYGEGSDAFEVLVNGQRVYYETVDFDAVSE